jgi:hypothetical protein
MASRCNQDATSSRRTTKLALRVKTENVGWNVVSLVRVGQRWRQTTTTIRRGTGQANHNENSKRIRQKLGWFLLVRVDYPPSEIGSYFPDLPPN